VGLVPSNMDGCTERAESDRDNSAYVSYLLMERSVNAAQMVRRV